MELSPPEGVRRIAERLEEAGFSTWAVGGAVRDSLMGHPAGDWDLATAATPGEVMEVFRRTVPIGVDHGTVGVLDRDTMYELTTFRRDIETFGRHAVVAFAETVEEDLSRRDFTINAVAWHPLRDEILDPFDGQGDMEAGRLRTVGDPAARFSEDYLRLLRALRFASRFDLEIEPATWRALTAAVDHLRELSAERVREELLKVLASRQASTGLELYRRSGALTVLYPELAGLVHEPPGDSPPTETPVGAEDPPGADGRDTPASRPGALWHRTLAAVDAVAPHRTPIRLAALLHATGKPGARTRDLKGGWRYTGHEVLGTRKAEDVMRRLKTSNADRERVVRLVRHQADLFPPDAPDAGVRRWLRDLGPDLVRDLFRLRFALWCGERTAKVARAGAAAAPGGEEGESPTRPDDLLERWRMAHRVLLDDPVLEPAGLAIGGGELRELGLEPGPRFGEILEELTERVIDDPSLNEPERLLDLVRQEWLDE